ncbi:hypothetical protein [Iodobacter sp.]|uniref:hypothetical protein n=1 Tax=Iodobacter sp. TaxID=1915058 RepID=UPI0025D1B10B|nr:hypothetical protein [Iodobacter sp.]
MSTMTSQVSVAFEAIDGLDTLQLEIDERDGTLNSPVQVNYTQPPSLFEQAKWASFGSIKGRPEPWTALLAITVVGQAHLRLYCRPSSQFKLYMSEPAPFIPAVPDLLVPMVGIPSSLFSVAVPPYVVRIPGKAASNKPPIESLGARESSEFEVLTFNFQRQAQLKRPFVSAVEILYSSIFINRAGETVPAPLPNTDLLTSFEATEEVAGSLVIRYNSHYQLLRCHYGLPSGDLLDKLRWAWLGGDVNSVGMPPLLVFAMSANSAAQISVVRSVWPSGFLLANTADALRKEVENPEGSRALAETGRISSTEKISSPLDPDNYIEVERAREITLQDGQGKIWMLKLAGKL